MANWFGTNLAVDIKQEDYVEEFQIFAERRVMRIQVTTVHRFLFLEVIVCLVAIVTNSEGGYLPLPGR
jgi:hypothetical protein